MVREYIGGAAYIFSAMVTAIKLLSNQETIIFYLVVVAAVVVVFFQ